jgi:hypothetical protein
MKLTPEQKQQRRLARKYGEDIFDYAVNQPNYYGTFSVYWYAKQAAQHAFRAHPELREA